MLEGPDLIDAALSNRVEFEAIYVDQTAVERDPIGALLERAQNAGVRVFAVAPDVLAKVADTQTPQPVVAAVRFDQAHLTALRAEGLVLVLHELRDPGNVGTIIRSADAAGVAAVVLTGHGVDPYNPKTLRATAGSIFHLPVVLSDLEVTIEHFRSAGARTWASVVRGGTDLRDADLGGASVVVIGNEAEGLDEKTIELCDARLSIAMAGASESLNAGVAASLIAFGALWQRQGTDRSGPGPSLKGS